MADLALTATQIAPAFSHNSPAQPFVNTVIAAASITAGQAVYIDSNGKADLADASAAGTATALGIALETVGAGQEVDVLRRGHVYGFTITQAYSATIYLSDTAGALADAAGTVSKVMGYVEPLSDSDLTKVLFIDAR